MNGVWSVIPTIFDKNDLVNIEEMASLIEQQINNGVHGIVLLGTTSEVSTVSTEEQVITFSTITSRFSKRVKFMVGVGGNNTKEVEENIATYGKFCEYVMLTVPYYNRPSQEGLIEHFKYLANKFKNIKMIVYNIPGRTGVNLEVDSLVEILKDCTNIVGIKEATGNINQIRDTIVRTNISVMLGDDSLFLPGMVLGAKGVISVVSNIVSKEMVEIYNYCTKNDFNKALEVYNKIEHVCKTCFITSNPVPLKMILYRLGYITSENVRMPLKVSTNPKIINEINECVEKIRIQKDKK
jgi:4-hydroxy-tetrahydrodipicolinate synthase